MVKKIIKSLWKPDGMNYPKQPTQGKAKFQLWYGSAVIGELIFDNGGWVFTYSPPFKKQSKLLPIIDFPEKNKEYKSENLWPYFSARIPSTETPYVRKKIKKQGVDENNLVRMLSVFGRKAITSPYILETVNI